MMTPPLRPLACAILSFVVPVPMTLEARIRMAAAANPRSVAKVEGVPRTSIQKVNGFPAVPHAPDILAAVALIYGAEVLADLSTTREGSRA